MFNKLIDFGASLCDSYTAWIICSILFFAYLMGTEYKKMNYTIQALAEKIAEEKIYE